MLVGAVLEEEVIYELGQALEKVNMLILIVRILLHLGFCDDSGFDFNHKHLIKQIGVARRSSCWTGFLVGQPYLDVPQEQNRPPLVKNDPRPVLLSRVPGTSRQSIYNPPGSIGMPNGPVTSVIYPLKLPATFT